MRTAAFLSIVLVGTPSVSWASPDIRMICKNPAREYFLTYSDGDASVIINPDSTADELRLLAALFDDRQYVPIVAGASSMTALVHYKPYKKVDWFSDGQLVQTDACHE